MARNSNYSEPGTVTYIVFYWDNEEKGVRTEDFDEDREDEAHAYAKKVISNGKASHAHVRRCEYVNGYNSEIKVNKRFEDEE